MNSNIIDKFRKLIDVNTPIIYIQDYDFVRVDEFIERCTRGSKKHEWNPATGVTDFRTKVKKGTGFSLKEFLNERLFDNLTTKKGCHLENL